MHKIYNKKKNCYIELPSESNRESIDNDFVTQNQNPTDQSIRLIAHNIINEINRRRDRILVYKCVTVALGGALSAIGASLIKSVFMGHVDCRSDIIIDSANGLLGLFLGGRLIYHVST